MKDSIDRASFLGGTRLFAGVPLPVRQAIAELLTLSSFAEGQLIMRKGEQGDALYLVVSGRVQVVSARHEKRALIAELGEGESVGEVAVLAGGARSADVYAATDCELAVLARHDFEQLMAEFPSELAAPAGVIAGRLRRAQLAEALRESHAFGQLDELVLQALEAELQLTSLRSGEFLFRKGEPGDSLFLVISGRLRVLVPVDDHEERTVAELGRGDMVGEMAAISQETRSADVLAIRDTNLARLDRPALERITSQHALPVLSMMGKHLARQLRNETSSLTFLRPEAASIGCFWLTPSAEMGEFCRNLAAALGPSQSVLHLDSNRVDSIFGRPGTARSGQVDASNTRLVEWLSEQESRFHQVVYQADTDFSAWTFRCLRQSDHIVLVADADEDRSPAGEVARRLLGGRNAASTPKTLVLLYRNPNRRPSRTAEWLNQVGADRHLHLRVYRTTDYERVARYVTGRSIGLVLGGGFARGIAHIGLIRAMRELGIPIDMVGGTSMGAILAGQCAIEWDCSQMLDITTRLSVASLENDFTLPVVSLMSGERMRERIGMIAENRDLEDAWLPLFCISASLTRCEMKVHDRGDAAQSILASARIPVLFPPIAWNNELLVDGGLVNMVPADVMKSFANGGSVVASDVSPFRELASDRFDEASLSGWRALRNRFGKQNRKSKKLTMLDILMRTMEFGRVPYDSQSRDKADLYLIQPLAGFSSRDFSRGAEMVEVAYRYSKSEIEKWMNASHRPWEPRQQSRQELEPVVPFSTLR